MPLSAPQPMTAPSGDPAEHTAPAMPSSTVATCTTVSVGCKFLHLGHPSGDPLPQVSRTLARHMRCMNCQTRIIPSPSGRLPASVAVTAPHTARHRARDLGGRGPRQPVLWGKLRYGQKGPLFNLWILPTWWIRRWAGP